MSFFGGLKNMLKNAFNPIRQFQSAKNAIQSAGRGDWKGALRQGVGTAIPGGIPGLQEAADMPFRMADAAKNKDWKNMVGAMVPGAGAVQSAARGDWKGAMGRLANPMGEMASAAGAMAPGAYAKGPGQAYAKAPGAMTGMLQNSFAKAQGGSGGGGEAIGGGSGFKAQDGSFIPVGGATGGFMGGPQGGPRAYAKAPAVAQARMQEPDANAKRKMWQSQGQKWNGQGWA